MPIIPDMESRINDLTGLSFLEGQLVKAYTITGQVLTGEFHLCGTWATIVNKEFNAESAVNLDHISGIVVVPQKSKQ